MNRDRARELAKQAFAAYDEEDYATAERIFAEAMALYDAVTLRVGHAQALQGMGRWIQAVAEYRGVLQQAPSDTEPEAFENARETARRELAGLEAKLPQLTVVLTGGGGAQVIVDGNPWPTEEIHLPHALDPGEHTVRVLPDNAGPVEHRITLQPGVKRTVTVASPLAATQEATVTPPPTPSVPADRLPPRASSKRGVALVGLVATGVLTIATIVTGAVALNKRSTFHDNNTASTPIELKEKQRSSARTWAWINTGTLVGAVGALGATAYLWTKPPATTARSDQAGAATGATLGVTISGRF